MAKRVGVISIDLVAGTAQFKTEMVSAKAQIVSVADAATKASHAMVSQNQAAAGTLRVMTGGLNNNMRAVENFMTRILGIGPALQAAFAVTGAVAFGEFLVSLGIKVYDFFKKSTEAADRFQNAFRDIYGPMKLANDELRVANDQLSNDIAKLEGRPENSLAKQLDDASVAADKLADSLERDLKALNKLLKEENVNWFHSLLTNTASTTEIKDYMATFQNEVGRIMDTGQAKIDDARKSGDKTRQKAAVDELNTTLEGKYGEALKFVNKQIEDRQKIEDQWKGAPFGMRAMMGAQDQIDILNQLRDTRSVLRAGPEHIELEQKNIDLQQRKDADAVAEANRKAAEKKAKDSWDELLAIEERGGKLLASERRDFRERELAALQAYGTRFKELIVEVTKEIGALDQEAFAEYKAAHDKDEREQKEFLQRMVSGAGLVPSAFTRTLQPGSAEAIEAQDANLKATIKGGQESNKFWTDQFAKPTEPRPDIKQIPIVGDDLRTRLEQMAKEGNLFDQLLLNQMKLKDLHYETVTVMEVEVQQAEAALTALQAGNYTTGERIEQEKKILELQYQLSDLESGKKAEDELLKVMVQHKLELGTLRDGWAAFWLSMEEQAEKPGKILFDSMNKTLDDLSAQLAKLITRQKTSFAEMFKSIGTSMIESSIKSGIQKGLGELAKIILPKKKLPPRQDGQTEKGAIWVQIAQPQNTDDPGDNPPAATKPSVPAPSVGGAIGAALLGLLFGALTGKPSGGGSSPTFTTDSTFTPDTMGYGGDVTADRSYIVGDDGPEILTRTTGKVMSNMKSRQLVGGGGNVYNIDARGGDPVLTPLNVKRAIEATHKSAVETGLRASDEQSKRMPK